MNDLRATFRQARFFDGVSDGDLDRLLAFASIKDVNKGQVIYKSGSKPDYLVFVQAGLLESIEYSGDGAVLGISKIHKNQMVGIAYLFNLIPRAETIRACEDSRVVLLNADLLSRLLVSNPESAYNLCTIFTSLMHDMRQEKEALSIPGAANRILAVLSRFAVKVDGKYYLAQVPTQQYLADMANTTRETVSRTLSQLSQAQVIVKEGARLRILRPGFFKT